MRSAQQRRYPIGHIRLLSTTMGLILFLSGIAQADFSIPGMLPNLEPGSLLQLLREDLDERSQSLEGEIFVQADRSFEANFNGEPGLFSLALPSSRKIALAINSNQQISIEADPASLGGYTVKGSPDTEILLAYESVRKESRRVKIFGRPTSLCCTKSVELHGQQKSALIPPIFFPPCA